MDAQRKAINILDEAVTVCSKLLGNKVTDAYLYGSYARGDYHPESDVDILLAVDMEPEELQKYRRKISTVNSDLSLEHDITVSITVKALAQFRKYADTLPYYMNVLREGIRYGG